MQHFTDNQKPYSLTVNFVRTNKASGTFRSYRDNSMTDAFYIEVRWGMTRYQIASLHLKQKGRRIGWL